MEPPAPGESIECVQIHGRALDKGDVRAVVTGTDSSVVIEWWRTPEFGLRRCHLHDEIDRSSPRLWDVMQRVSPVAT